MTITDDDRKAAADILDEVASLIDDVGIGQVADLIRDGEYDEHAAVALVAAHRIASERRALERAAEALRDAEATLALVEHEPFGDPATMEAVRTLGDRIGYGNMMATASALWRAELSKQGLAGGEFVAGPCHSTIKATLAKVRLAIRALPGGE